MIHCNVWYYIRYIKPTYATRSRHKKTTVEHFTNKSALTYSRKHCLHQSKQISKLTLNLTMYTLNHVVSKHGDQRPLPLPLLYLIYIKPKMSVCFGQFSAELDQIWHVASLYLRMVILWCTLHRHLLVMELLGMSEKTRICDCHIFGTLPPFSHILLRPGLTS